MSPIIPIAWLACTAIAVSAAILNHDLKWAGEEWSRKRRAFASAIVAIICGLPPLYLAILIMEMVMALIVGVADPAAHRSRSISA
jgi:hypothetical protein